VEARRLRGDIIEVFKIFKRFEDVSYNTYFTLLQLGLRGYSYKLYKPNFRLDIRKFSFSVDSSCNKYLECTTVLCIAVSLGLVFEKLGISISFDTASFGSPYTCQVKLS